MQKKDNAPFNNQPNRTKNGIPEEALHPYTHTTSINQPIGAKFKTGK
jgi:hypothetical protein